jgi:serine/threonine protein phosphatase PrpC
MRQGPRLNAAGRTDPGVKRQSNQDRWLNAARGRSPEQLMNKGYLYLVADGVGGHQGGDVASEMAVRITSQAYYADPNPDIHASLEAAIQEANRQIYRQGISNAGQHGMSTTITAAVVRGNELVVANVGDSRAYLIRQGRPRLLTIDHTWVEEKRREGLLTDAEAANHPQRNVITRSLGGDLHVQVDVFPSETLQPGDEVVLCSDGLSDIVQAGEIAAVVRGSRSPAAAVEQLVTMARQRGAPDNVVVGVIGVAGRGVAADARLGSAVGPIWIMAGVTTLAAAAIGLALLLRNTGSAAPRPTPAAPATEAPTPSPTATVAAATEAPLVPPRLLSPDAGDAVYVNNAISFSWDWSGQVLGEGQRFFLVVRSGGQEVFAQPVDGTVLELAQSQLGQGVGEYQWLVKVEEDVEGEWEELARSEERALRIVPWPTAVPPTATPMPPTEIPPTQPPAPPQSQPTSPPPPPDPTDPASRPTPINEDG